jgi:hypothetical protein
MSIIDASFWIAVKMGGVAVLGVIAGFGCPRIRRRGGAARRWDVDRPLQICEMRLNTHNPKAIETSR